MIKLTDKAIVEVKKLIQKESNPNTKLRVKVIGAGCSGYSYNLSFDNNLNNLNDKEFSQNDIKIIIDSKSLLFIDGMELDFTEGLSGKGFVFNNPNAKRSCGCGNSFSV